MSLPIKITELWCYPVKSCAGIRLTQATLGPRGMVNDRAWMVIRPDGMFLTQREYPRLAVITPSFDETHLWLAAPDSVPIAVPLHGDGLRIEVTVWRDQCDGIDQGDEIAVWLSTVLGTECRLVRMPDDWVRTVDQTFAQPDDRVGFADGFPLLIASESSLGELNERMGQSVPMNRFRPNVVVAGAAPFAEDTWQQVRVGDVAIRVVKPCARCVATTIEQETGSVRGPEPLATLATFRRQNGKVMFAQNAIHDRNGTLRVGDTLEVLTTDG